MDACKYTLAIDLNEEMPLDNLPISPQRSSFSSYENECWKTAEEVLADLQMTDDEEPEPAKDTNQVLADLQITDEPQPQPQPQPQPAQNTKEVLADIHIIDDDEPEPAEDTNLSQELAKLELMTLEDFLIDLGIVRKQKGYELEDFMNRANTVKEHQSHAGLVLQSPPKTMEEKSQATKAKKRASAARSRAKKEAHIEELRQEKNRVMKQNTLLKEMLAERGRERQQEKSKETGRSGNCHF